MRGLRKKAVARHRMAIGVALWLMLAPTHGQDEAAEPEQNAPAQKWPEWIARFEPDITKRLLDWDDRPEVVRKIVIDWLAFHTPTWMPHERLQVDRDLFHQLFLHDSVLRLTHPQRRDQADDLLVGVVPDPYGDPWGSDQVKEFERYPPVSEEGWRTIRAPGQGAAGRLEWNAFEPACRSWGSMYFIARDDGSVKELDLVTFFVRVPGQRWWGDVTGDGELNLLQWAPRFVQTIDADGKRDSTRRFFLEVWRIGWEPELLGAVLLASGELNSIEMPLFELQPPGPQQPRTIGLIPLAGLARELEPVVLHWNDEGQFLETDQGPRAEGPGWKLIPRDMIRQSVAVRGTASWTWGLPVEVAKDERWETIDLKEVMAEEERDRLLAGIRDFIPKRAASHIFGEDPHEPQEPYALDFGLPQERWRGRMCPPFDYRLYGFKRMFTWSPREAVDYIVRYHMPEELSGHYHVLVEPQAEKSPWDAQSGWLVSQSGDPVSLNGTYWEVTMGVIDAVGWGTGDTAWRIRVSNSWRGDAPERRFSTNPPNMGVGVLERDRAAWLGSAWWWLDQHRSLTLTLNAPAGWPQVKLTDPGFGGDSGRRTSDLYRMWLHGGDPGTGFYLPPYESPGVAWTGPWSRRTTHAFAHALYNQFLGHFRTNWVVAQGNAEDAEPVWDHVRQWLDGSHPAFLEHELPPLPPVVRVGLVTALAEANHQPAREWLLALQDGLPEPDDAELALAEIVLEFERANQAWGNTDGPDRYRSQEALDWWEATQRLEAAQVELLNHPHYRLRRVLPLALRQLQAWDDENELRKWAGENGAPGQSWAEWKRDKLAEQAQ